ncbi:hypothetical protein [Streptomyces sp. AC550_RSS872]|uniref:hypothetical protein n=1 Tax=Streptomyces sp. AC550_RSS872 TaxID=2823689 RepID=UPI001C259A77|nr:hypothetical protein [Streptomyces sp. AC550_RSS872]
MACRRLDARRWSTAAARLSPLKTGSFETRASRVWLTGGPIGVVLLGAIGTDASGIGPGGFADRSVASAQVSSALGAALRSAVTPAKPLGAVAQLELLQDA